MATSNVPEIKEIPPEISNLLGLRDAARLTAEIEQEEDLFEDLPAWVWPEYQSGALTPIERLMVAVYERAIKDLTNGITSKSRDRWAHAYDAIVWFLDDERRCWDAEVADGFYPFRYVCEVMDWDPSMVLSKSRREYYRVLDAFLRRRMRWAASRARKARNGGRKAAYAVLCWVLSEDDGPTSFLNACERLELDPRRARQEFRKLMLGRKGTGYLGKTD